MSTQPSGVYFRCKYCHFIFGTAKELVDHKRVEHADEILQIVSVTGNYKPLPEGPTLEPVHHEAFEITIENAEDDDTPAEPIEADVPVILSYESQNNDYLKVHPALELRCRFCPKVFNYQEALSYHEKRVHTVEKPASCQYCSKLFAQRTICEHHEANLCPMKPQVILDGGVDNQHDRTPGASVSSSPGHNVCRFCGQEFVFKIQLNVHERTHSGDGPHPCRFCGIEFRLATSLQQHFQVCEKRTADSYLQNDPDSNYLDDDQDQYEEENYEEEQEQEEFIQTEIIVEPSRTLSKGPKNEFPCRYCPRICKFQCELTRHERTHTGEKPYPCKFCDKRFAQQGDANKHMLKYCGPIHAGKKSSTTNEEPVGKKGPFMMRLNPSNASRQHQRQKKTNPGVAAVIKKYVKTPVPSDLKCPTCDRRFLNAKIYQIHQLIHLGIKPFKCSDCDFETNNSGILSRHRNQFCGIKSHVVEGASPKMTLLSSPKKIVTSPNKAAITKSKNAARLPKAQSPLAIRGKVAFGFGTTAEKGRKSNGKQCRFCTKTFRAVSQRVTHERTHTGERPFACGKCLRRFSQKGHRNVHEKNCKSTRARKSTPIPQSTIQTEDLVPQDEAMTTEIERNGTKHYPCPHCPTFFNSPAKLKIHMNIHTGKKPYRCGKCGGRYNNPGTLIGHKRRCTGKAFAQRVNKVQNKIQMRTQRQPAEVNLSKNIGAEMLQPKSSSTIRYLPNLMRNIDGEGKVYYTCNICNKFNWNRTDMAKHTRVHIGPKPYFCPYCNEAFLDKKQVMDHEKSHPEANTDTETKTRYLEKCRSKAARIAAEKYKELDVNFVEVQDPQSSNRIFVCKLCPKTFPQRQYVREHVMSHLNWKPYQCDVCSKGFVRPNLLKSHMKKHKNSAQNYQEEDSSSIPEDGAERSQDEEYQPDDEEEQEDEGQEDEEQEYEEQVDEEQEYEEQVDEEQPEIPSNAPEPETPVDSMNPAPENIQQVKALKRAKIRPTIDTHYDEEIVNGTKVFNCKLCDKVLRRRTNAREHVMRHTGEMPYSCQECHLGFFRPILLKQHIQAAHANPHPDGNQCRLCKIKFPLRVALNVHMRGHSGGTKPFVCLACGLWFRWGFKLKRHMSQHDQSDFVDFEVYN